MNICVIGVGYVGLVTGTCFAEFGVEVTCVDNNENRIESLKNGMVPFFEPGLEEMVTKNHREGRLHFTTDLKKGVEDALVIFIAVGTPSGNSGEADLSYVREVARTIGQYMNGYKVIVTKSTVPVGTGKMVAGIVKENQTRPIPFDIASNPEFLREGAAIEDFMRPNRVVIGAESEQALAILKDLYKPLFLIETPFVMTNVQTSEMIKYASNAFLATKISFINEMANLCEMLDVDIHKVAKAMGLDNRIGPKFLHPGPGYGGSCFPKDTQALARIASEKEYDFKLVNAVIEVNERQRDLMVSKIQKFTGGVAGKTVCVLGLAFKPNTDDIRESPAIYIVRKMLEMGANIRAFDPEAMPASRGIFPDIYYAENLYDAADTAEVMVIITEWNQFRAIQWGRVKGLMTDNKVIDLRNIYDPEQMSSVGFDYTGVGR